LKLRPKSIFTFQVAPDRPELNDGPSFARFHQGLLERLAAMQGVESVGLVNELPLDEAFAPGRFATESSEASGDVGRRSSIVSRVDDGHRPLFQRLQQSQSAADSRRIDSAASSK